MNTNEPYSRLRGRVAILMLACSDYEAMELALACHGAFLPEGVPFFILQNCRGTYDSERTFLAAKRMERLFPEQVQVVDDIPPGAPYHSISKLLNSDRFKEIDFVCKVDDDAFPLAKGWLDKLLSTYEAENRSNGEPLAYVTPLINNNTWGFAATLKAMGLVDEYLKDIARPHIVGSGHSGSPFRLLPGDEIYTGANGTIWGAPHVARWLHERTTLDPDRFVKATELLPSASVPSHDRYSIGCILLRKELWSKIDDGGADDEAMLHSYCRRTGARIICAQSVPFVHLAYFVQREENRDIVEQAREKFQTWLRLSYPIALRASRELEIESRLRWIEGQTGFASAPIGPSVRQSITGAAAATPQEPSRPRSGARSVFESLRAIGYVVFPFNRRRRRKRKLLMAALRSYG